MSGRFKDNPAYVEYETLLKQLHRLLAGDQGDSEAADEIREHMAVLESRLNRREIIRLNGLSADLYMLQGDEILEQPPAARDQAELYEHIKEYERWNDWDSVLALLRRRPPLISDEAVAFSRARAYATLGHHDTALLFFEYAMARRFGSPDMRAMHLFMLKDARRHAEAIDAGTRYATDAAAPPMVLIANAVTRYGILGAGAAGDVLKLISQALEQISPKQPAPVEYVVLAYLTAAACLTDEGRIDDAIAALGEALRYRPDDVAIEEARQTVRASRDADLSESLRRAMESAKAQSGGHTVTNAHPVWGKAA